MKKILATLVTATVIGAGGVAVASATESPKRPTTESAKPTGDSTTARDAIGTRMRRLVFTTAATTIGISPADLLDAMKGGHSIADVAKDHGVEAPKVVDAIVTTIDARIDQAVTRGRLTSDQATKLKQVVATRVPKLVNATPREIRRHRVVKAAIAVSAQTIGITPEALRQAMVAGHSVAQVATAHGVDPKTVVAALVTAGTARIDKAVANHRLDKARAAKLKARLPTAAQRFVDFVRGAAKQPAAAA
jgi:uncharacterized protein (DUF433 family)